MVKDRVEKLEDTTKELGREVSAMGSTLKGHIKQYDLDKIDRRIEHKDLMNVVTGNAAELKSLNRLDKDRQARGQTTDTFPAPSGGIPAWVKTPKGMAATGIGGSLVGGSILWTVREMLQDILAFLRGATP